MTLKRTPFFARHQAAGGRLIDFGGWELPVQFEGIIAEHQRVREKVGLFDVSHMGEVRVRGRRALEAVRHAKLPLAITHAPGHMFVCDVRNVELAVGNGGGGGGGRRGLLPLLVLGGALLLVAVGMTVEEWRATQGPAASPAAAVDNVASLSFVTRALARLLEVRLSLGTAVA